MWKACAYGGVGGLAACGALARLSHKNYRRARVPPKTKYCYAAPPSREEMIKRMKEEVYDIVVIGGGATGSGVALDAASRGLKCALVEADDFGCGTSSRSTKLIHGGIRYLEMAMKKLDVAQFKLLCEALTERCHLMTSAPHMARPVPILMPVYKFHEIPMFLVGVKMYDWIGKFLSFFNPGLPNCFWISKSNSTFFFPLLNSNRLKGSIVYYDGQMNDARLNLQIALTASVPNFVPGMQSAAVANHCRVHDIKIQKGSTDSKSVVEVEDTLSGDKFSVRATAVVNCTGPLSDAVRQKAACRPVKNLVTTSSGVHVALPSYYSSSPFGMIIPQTTDGRVLYYLPWEGNTIAGTTDEPVSPTALPKATKREVDFVVKESCRYLSVEDEDLRKDIRSTWSGLRPLVTDPKSLESDSTGTEKLSRTHEIVVEKNGCISVLGGKWTTYRRMAEDAVDRVLKVHGSLMPKAQAARTKFLLLANAVEPTKRFNTTDINAIGGKLPIHLVHSFGLSIQQAQHLVSNYGFRAVDLCEMGRSLDLLQPLVDGHPFLRAEVVYGVRHEMARTATDVLGRRMRLAFVDVEAARHVLDEVVSVMSKELRWTPDTCRTMREGASRFLGSMEGGM